jgi:hypothetical protein
MVVAGWGREPSGEFDPLDVGDLRQEEISDRVAERGPVREPEQLRGNGSGISCAVHKHVHEYALAGLILGPAAEPTMDA